MAYGKVLVGLIFCSLTGLIKCQTHDDVKAVLTKLFTTDGYNKIVRPAADQTVATKVYIDFHLVGINDVDEVQERMSSTAYLYMSWNDDYLKWTAGTYNGVYVLYIPQNQLWKPDIALENGFSKMKELGDDFLLTIVYDDGAVIWTPFEVFETKCSINIEYFPFDKQTCDIKFGVWTTPLSDVDVELGTKGIILDSYQKNGEWEIVGTSASATESKNYGAVVTFTVIVKRKPQYIIYNIVLPILLLSLLSVFVFALPVDSGEKLGYIMTLYLAFAVFLTIVSSSLPVSSSMSLLSLYLILLLFVGTTIVIITTLQLRIHYLESSRKIPGCVKGLVRFGRVLRCRKSFRKVQDANGKIPNGKATSDVSPPNVSAELEPHVKYDEITWPDVTSALDFFCFWIFLLAIVLITLIIFVKGYLDSEK